MPGSRGSSVVDGLPPLSSLVKDTMSVLSFGRDGGALWVEEGPSKESYAAIVEIQRSPMVNLMWVVLS